MEEFEDFGFVEREELMISPTGDGEPTFRSAHFLQPTVTSIDGPVFEIPNDCISSVPPTFEPKNWPLEVKYNGWRQPTKDWRTWVEKMCSLHESTWKKSGIREAIWSSTYEVHRNNDLVLGLAEKWCPDTKKELKRIEQKLNQAKKELNRCASKKASYGQWMKKFMGTGLDIEHEAFLALWLSSEKELNDSLVPPGFAPKFNLVETRDSVDEDDLSIAEILRSTNVHREILRSNSLEKSLEKSPKTPKRKKKDINSSVTLGSLLKKAKTPVETSKEKENVCDVSTSAGSSSSNKLPPCLTVEEEPNDPPVLPGFAPEFNLVETMDSVDDDDMTIAEILRSKNVRFMDGDNSASHSRDFSSSVADNEAAKIVEEKIMQNEFVKVNSGTVLEDAAERTSGSPDNDTEQRIRGK
ncbi:hypothetical protein LWI29_018794 [Acer saccharum]|uniref:Aminotransferase-like plant mobile domain-containing protein n=1 Tax=Acer saccharum TaxID=4024 RepID=A0AA39VVF6_ACESA|nr:hypothetical protein LWI29_018794 [Acer saccharum]